MTSFDIIINNFLSKVTDDMYMELTKEEINIISTYMVVQWISVQLASVDLTRQLYGGNDFKLTSQANHLSKLTNLKVHFTEQGFHLQRLYGRRQTDTDGIYRSTMCNIMTPNPSFKWGDER